MSDVVATVHAQERAFVEEHFCELYKSHQPMPTMTEYHHQKPVFLQNRLYGKIQFGPSLWVCGNCHDAIHAWLYYLLGEHRKPGHVGRKAKQEAERTFKWYIEERDRLGL